MHPQLGGQRFFAAVQRHPAAALCAPLRAQVIEDARAQGQVGVAGELAFQDQRLVRRRTQVGQQKALMPLEQADEGFLLDAQQASRPCGGDRQMVDRVGGKQQVAADAVARAKLRDAHQVPLLADALHRQIAGEDDVQRRAGLALAVQQLALTAGKQPGLRAAGQRLQHAVRQRGKQRQGFEFGDVHIGLRTRASLRQVLQW